MDLNSLKSNSKEKKKERKMPNYTVKGKVETKEKSTGRKVFESLLAEDVKTIKDHVIEDRIKPAILEMIFSAVTDGLEMALFGMAGRKRKPSRDSGGYTAYGSYFKAGGSKQNSKTSRTESRKSTMAIDEIEFEFKEDAENVRDLLCEDIQEYGNVSVEVLKHLLGKPTEYTDRKYGWTDLSSASVDRIRGGTYILSLPRVEVIE